MWKHYNLIVVDMFVCLFIYLFVCLFVCLIDWLFSPDKKIRNRQSGRFRTGMFRTTYTILLHFAVWWPCMKKWCFVVILSTIGKVNDYKTMVNLGDWLNFICKRDENIGISYGTVRNPPRHAPFFCQFFYEMAFPSSQDNQWILLLYSSTMSWL